MENASKALIMAGSVLIALMIIGALVLMFNNLTAYQQSNNVKIEDEEVIEFNSGYATYIRRDVRGNDLISLIHKIVDYNNRKLEDGYSKMYINIKGIDTSKSSPLKYDTNKAPMLIKNEYNEGNLDEYLIKPVQELESKYQQKYISALASNISNIMKTKPNENESEEEIGAGLAKRILKLNYVPNDNQMNTIRDDTQKYYEYQQFKRAYFDVVNEPEYDSKTGRIVKINFKYVRTGE